MNARDPWSARQHDSERLARGYRSRAAAHDTSSSILDRLHEPSVLVPLLILVVTVLFSCGADPHHLLPGLLQCVWDALVALTPARLLFAVDGWLNPPLFPRDPKKPPAPMQPATYAAKSEALRRILRLDAGGPGGIMASVSQAGRRPGTSFGFAKPDCARPAGLGNLSNSCYQNSILQGLASLKPLPEYLRLPATVAEAKGGADSGVSAKTAGTLLELISDLNAPENNGHTLWTPAVLKNMSTWQQQDAQEYFSKLLDEVDREVAKAHSDDSGYQSLPGTRKPGGDVVGPWAGHGSAAALRNPLEGLTAQRVACVACGWSEGLSMIPFNCITLSLGMDRREHDLYERLDAYTRVERIPGVECGRCTLLEARRLMDMVIKRMGVDKAPPTVVERAAAIEQALEEDDFEEETISRRCQITKKIGSTKTKQAVIARGPQSLVIHMNRSVFDDNTGQMFKNLATVRFPMLLDLGPWCLGSAGKPPTRAAAPPAAKEEDEVEESEKPSPPIDEEHDNEEEDEEDEEEEEQWLLDPTTSMVAGPNKSKLNGPIYELRAVVTHQGRHENGHYICYRKHPRPAKPPRPGSSDDKKEAATPPNLAPDDPVGSSGNKATASASEVETRPPAAQNPSSDRKEAAEEEEEEDADWWRLSDESVVKVSEDVVQSQGGVFMLFYDCVDPVPVLTSELEESPASVSTGQEEEGGEDEEEGEEEEASSMTADTDPTPPPLSPAPRRVFDEDGALDEARSVSLPVGE
ncbi:hypothetical protein MAPG_11640 [Magnaporthiopsis poae ATCC 64411]|uniref:ubiquitinyl hydrolase 1 n=1 Tax=Magnaporthiopsis poae (strain ATCC 64411 / 73-15) TaxID=644358 RepID=A0A0C4EFT4_MAGP6|nr:hypothetical protein MAPG_11640 [Magnaporthiopsis poae ATCC 64411]